MCKIIKPSRLITENKDGIQTIKEEYLFTIQEAFSIPIFDNKRLLDWAKNYGHSIKDKTKRVSYIRPQKLNASLNGCSCETDE